MSPVFTYKSVQAKGNSRMTEVFKAVRVGADGFTKTVAIKKLLPQYSSQIAMMNLLSSEIKKHSQMTHPNIVQLLDFFKEEDRYCIVMEYVHGLTLERILQICKSDGRMLTWQQSLYVVAEILKGLEYAHTLKNTDGQALNILHLNLNPKNILISFNGEVKITDFCMSRLRIQSRELFEELKAGRYCYSSPEILLNTGIGPKADIYSTGIMLYEMLSMHQPFANVPENPSPQVFAKMEHETLFSFMPNLDSGIAHLAEHAMERNPQNRYAQALDFYDHVLEEQDPSWAVHGQGLFKSLIDEIVPVEQRREDENLTTIPLAPKLIKEKDDKVSFIKAKEEVVSTGEFIKQWLAGSALFLIVAALVFYKWDPLHMFNEPAAAPVSFPPPVAQKEALPENRKELDPSRTTGEINFNGPDGIEIYVNKKKMGVLPMDPVVLRPGSYNILLKKGEDEKMKFVNVVSQQSVQIAW